MEEPHARLERFDQGMQIEIDDPNCALDFIYVLKGGIQINLELNQVQQVLKNQNLSEDDDDEYSYQSSSDNLQPSKNLKSRDPNQFIKIEKIEEMEEEENT